MRRFLRNYWKSDHYSYELFISMTWQINSLKEWHSSWITLYIYTECYEVSNILRGGSTHQNKKKKKSNKHGSEKAYFLSSVHLFIVADDVWLWVRLRDRQGKYRGNKYCIGTVVAEGKRDALPWTDVTLSTSYNKCHEWTSGWTSPMDKCVGLQVAESMRFRTHV